MCDFSIKTKALQYDLAAIFNKAYISVATTQKTVSGFHCTEISPMNRSIFIDQDFFASDALQAPNGAVTFGPRALIDSLSNGLVEETVLYNMEDIPVASDSSLLENIEHIHVDVVDVEENVLSFIPQPFAVGSLLVEMRVDPEAPSNDIL